MIPFQISIVNSDNKFECLNVIFLSCCKYIRKCCIIWVTHCIAKGERKMIKDSITFRRDLWEDGEYTYAAAYGFMPNIHAFLHDDDQIRPALLMIPGGGYCMVTPHEGECVSQEFFDRGMNVFILTYTTDITMSVPLRTQPMQDASRAIRLIRKNATEYRIDPNRLTIVGFSAGGHLCACVATHYEDIKDNNPQYCDISNRPDSVIVGYPVITAGEFTHIYSIWALVGSDAPQEARDYFSLEKHVTKDTPPCFMWQTVEDNLVPIENTMLFSEAYRKAGVPYTYYAFPHGWHGLSVLNNRFKTGDIGGEYCSEQLNNAIAAVKNRTAVNVSEQRRTELMIQFFGNPEGKTKEELAAENGGVAPEEPKKGSFPPPPDYKDIELWPCLAEAWLKSINML